MGYPPEARDPESRRKYLEDHREHQWVTLEEGKNKNLTRPGDRWTSSVSTASGESLLRGPTLVQMTLIKDLNKFLNYVFSGKHRLHHVSFLDGGGRGAEDRAMVQWTYREECVVASGSQQ